jgi:non-specific serine/threonine protein kinase/serine/threonine-protein kinase
MDRDARVQQIVEALRPLPTEHHRGAAIYYATGDEALALDALAQLAAPAKRREFKPHDRLGAYEIDREVGRGGMGVVYAAHRADAEYDKLVALKIVHWSGLPGEAARRFRNERQILASLEHPNITRLLDGGVTPDGAPYLVMEYVAGLPMDKFLRARDLPLNARLVLFLKVCHAVHHAHQHLVIHRDLKPANVLVTVEGEPKLLDFGIAKLLDPTGSRDDSATVTNAMLTPGYASPEQAAGRAVTTSSDLYSLGVILHEILSGRRPFAESTGGELLYAVLSRDVPPLPSSIDRDLDAIVHKCLGKAPADRYASVYHLGQDVQRYLENRPVLARKRAFGYQAGKFIRRHWPSLAGALVLLVSIVVGTVSTYQQKRVAERRFADVRQVVRYLLFDLYDDAAKIPGSTSLRTGMVKSSLAYMDVLATDAAGDKGIRQELIEGYQRLGDTQGNLTSAGLGDTASAIAAYKKGLELASNDTSPAIRRLRASLLMQMGLTEAGAGLPGGIENVRKSVAIYEQLNAAAPREGQPHLDVGLALFALGRQLSASAGPGAAPPEVRKHLDAAARELEWALELKVGEAVASRALADVYHNIGATLGSSDPVRSEQFETKALATFDRLPPDEKARPVNVHFRANLLSQIGLTLSELHRFDDAIRALSESIIIMDQAIAADPANALYLMDQSATLRVAGIVSANAGRREEALVYFRRAVTLHEGLIAKDPRSISKGHRAELLNRMGEIELELGQRIPAKRDLEAGIRALREIAAQPKPSATQLIEAARMTALAPLPELRDLKAAKAYVDHAVQLTPNDAAPHELAGNIAYLQGDKTTAVKELELALQLLPPTREGAPPSRSRIGIKQLLDKIQNGQ